jgi:hypothetical protein
MPRDSDTSGSEDEGWNGDAVEVELEDESDVEIEFDSVGCVEEDFHRIKVCQSVQGKWAAAAASCCCWQIREE